MCISPPSVQVDDIRSGQHTDAGYIEAAPVANRGMLAWTSASDMFNTAVINNVSGALRQAGYL